MDTNQVELIRKYVDMAFRRKLLIFTCIILGSIVGIAYYMNQPKIYQSSTLLSYQQQSVNPARMSPDEQQRTREIVSTLTQIVTSRSNLERVIVDLNLYENLRQNGSMEGAVMRMGRNISVTPSRQGSTFEVTFTGNNPDKVAQVNNAIASMFIEENLRYREKKASEASAYTEDELQTTKAILDEKEAVMRDYKLKYYNEMSEQQDNNMSRLIALQGQYQSRQESIQDLERTRVLIQDQIGARRTNLATSETLRTVLAQTGNQEPQQVVETDQERLERSQALLNSLEIKYTDQHPAIKKLKKEITQLEQILAENRNKETGASQAGAPTRSESYDDELVNLQIQLKDIGLNIKMIENGKAELQEMINQYEKWVAAAPIREAEWSSLTREYGELRRHYEFLVSQNLQAKSVLNQERKQRGSQFKIEDPAQVPIKPISPNFPSILIIALLAGGVAGGTLAFVIESLDTSVRDSTMIESALGTKVICSVPYLPLKRELVKKRLLGLISWIYVLVSCTAVAAAITHLYINDQIIL